MFKRRLGPDPHANGQKTPFLEGCPDILERENGDFAIIGRDITAIARGKLPQSVGCGPDEKICYVPFKTKYRGQFLLLNTHSR